MSLHLSKQAAAERATQLALDFMQRQETRGWDWSLSDATPDPIDPKKGGRKIATQWIALVRYSKDGSIVDGPAVLKINIENGSVGWADASA